MKRCLLTIALLFLLLSPRVSADDYQLIRNYIVDEVRKGKTQSHFAHALKVSDAMISLFINNKVTSSPKLLRNFKSRLPTVYQDLTTPQKAPKKKKVIAKKIVRKRLDFNRRRTRESFKSKSRGSN
jgi:predicted transcriptional regulator